jgi:3-hydroxyacyl-[acyl-carrier-protein] dehydratase
MDKRWTIEFEEVRRLVPQAHPFLMIDRVLDLVPGERVLAVKNVTGNETFFQGHFPQLAIMPAALILEGLGQAAIVLVKGGRPVPDDGSVYVFGSVHAKMLRPVLPGDVLHLEVRLLKSFDTGGAVQGTARVEDRVCTEAEMFFSKLRREDVLRNRSA